MATGEANEGPNPLLRRPWNQGQNGCRKLKPYTGRLRIAREFQGAGAIPGLHPANDPLDACR